ncbi:Cdc123 [Kluyveromyces lactis]|nr:Cdc123 [Kluyveromyces lactis]
MATESYTPLVDIKVRSDDIKACSFSSWYGKFKKYTPKAKIIQPLPEEFLRYLAQDGIRLSLEENDSTYNDHCLKSEDDNEYSDWEADDDGDNDSDSDDDKNGKEEEMVPMVNFPDLHREIAEVIGEYGAVTPKLNWSAPRDATWILPNNTSKCMNVNDIYLLLNASNYIAYDLDHAFDECEDRDNSDNQFIQFELVLRKWFDINPALEFRVFIRDSEICGISQRDLNYYNYLEPLQDTFRNLIEEFVHDIVLPNFDLKSFVLDVYLPRPFESCWLIDINPWSRITDPLLFSWNELASTDLDSDASPEIRLITEHNMGRFVTKEHSENQVPKDVVQASLDPESMRELTYKWKEILKMQEAESDSDSN